MSDDAPPTDDGVREAHLKQYREAEGMTEYELNRMHDQRSLVEQSDSALVSRSYQPRTGGPELVASWPLGPTPDQTEPGAEPWSISSTEYVQIQRNLFTLPYLGPIESSRIYLNVCGRGYIKGEECSLTLRLSCNNVSGKAHRTMIELPNDESERFLSPMIEVAPDDPNAYGDHEFIGREMYSGYVLSAKVNDGIGFLDQGTSVQLWSE